MSLAVAKYELLQIFHLCNRLSFNLINRRYYLSCTSFPWD